MERTETLWRVQYSERTTFKIVIDWCDSKINLYAHEAFFEKDESIPKKFSLIKLKKTKNRTAQDEWNPPL